MRSAVASGSDFSNVRREHRNFLRDGSLNEYVSPSLQVASIMIQCQQCGQGNVDQTQFCRFCGNRLAMPEGNQLSYYQQAQPRPYAWKTDEYQTQSEPRVRPQAGTQPVYHARDQFPGAQPLTYNAPQYMASNYRCPNCGTTVLPIIERRISTAGWITFSLLLVFTFVFFWIGLLMKQNYSVCPVCRATLN